MTEENAKVPEQENTPPADDITRRLVDAEEKIDLHLSSDRPVEENLANENQAVGMTPVYQKTGQKVKAYSVKGLRNRWLCPNGHTLGIIVQAKRNGHTITRLMKFPFAFEDEEFIPENLLCSYIDAGDICCTRCGQAREWMPGEWLMDKLLNHRKARKRNRNV